MPTPGRTTAAARAANSSEMPTIEENIPPPPPPAAGVGPTAASPPVVSGVSPKLPIFWSNGPRVWIRRIESQFRTSGITASLTKFDLAVQHLDEETSLRLQDFILNPPATDPFEALVARLTADFEKSTYERLVEFFSQPSLGDRRPSELASAIMQSVAGLGHDVQTCPFVQHSFLARLPESIRTPLADVKFEDMRSMAVKADKLWSTRGPSSSSAVLAVEEQPAEAVAAVQLAAPRRQQSSRRPQQQQQQPRRQQQQQQQQQRSADSSRFCYFHRRWGARANYCEGTCDWADSGNDRAGGHRN